MTCLSERTRELGEGRGKCTKKGEGGGEAGWDSQQTGFAVEDVVSCNIERCQNPFMVEKVVDQEHRHLAPSPPPRGERDGAGRSGEAGVATMGDAREIGKGEHTACGHAAAAGHCRFGRARMCDLALVLQFFHKKKKIAMDGDVRHPLRLSVVSYG